MHTDHGSRGSLLAFGIGIGMTLIASTVLASTAAASEPFEGGTTATIGEGRNAAPVGDAHFLREQGADGEQLLVRFEVEGGFDEAHLCLSAEPFAERIPPGQCPWAIRTPGTTGIFPAIALTGALADVDHLHAQLHVALSGGGTAYAGNTSGDSGSFFGDVAIERPTGGDGSTGPDEVLEPEVIPPVGQPPAEEIVEEVEDEPGLGDASGDTGLPSGGTATVDPAPQAGSPDDVAGEVTGPPVVPPTSLPADPPAGTDPPVVHAGPGPVVPGDGVTTLIDPVMIERPTEVLGTQLVRPAAGAPAAARSSLPRTGADTPDLLVLAGGLLLAGAAMVVGGRRAGAAA